MPSPKVSIIIPVYNVSRYLEKCLISIESQTLKEIEIIIVNDCSPDPLDDVICKKHSNNDNRIIYKKHLNNLGIGGARNTGIKLASADYIGFVDSDDFIDLSLFETCYNEAIKDDNDVVIFGYTKIDENDNALSTTIPTGDSKGDLFKNFLGSTDTVNPASWNKLWKKSLYIDNNIKFPCHVHNEDLATTPRLLYFAKNIKFLNKSYYYYLIRENSISNSCSRKHIDSAFTFISTLNEFLITRNESEIYRLYVQERFWQSIRYFLKTGMATAPEPVKEDILTYLRDMTASSNLVDISYFLSRKNYIECDLVFRDLPSYIDSTLNIRSLVNIRKSKEKIEKKYEKLKSNRWYQFGQLSKTDKLIFIPTFFIKKVRDMGLRQINRFH